ncbi:MAG TPA: ABC transporter substrate-binding protein [Bacillota bacterium]|nr:ABC transporter substrate-binding protein [Bacillota bacterium]
MRKFVISIIFISLIFTTACGQNDASENSEDASGESTDDLKKVTFVLDWTPNTNHTGIYVAQEQGFFEEHGLDVEIILPGEVESNQLVATEKADFGINYQERITMARAEDLPLVSIAAVIQHNTAGYASPTDRNISRPKDFEGKSFGGIGAPIQEAMMQMIMEADDADMSEVDIVNIGQSDWFTAVERDVDFSTIYYGWTGIEAEVRGVDIDMMYYIDFAEELDFYTPVLITSEAMIDEDPETVEAFVHAATKGYEFTIDNPEEAADILIEREPDLDPELVKRSQEWLADKYQDDADQWGLQELERWEVVIDFLYENDIIAKQIDAADSFTTDFLP